MIARQIITALALTALAFSCNPEDPNAYKWHDAWREKVPEEDTTAVIPIKGKPRYVWVDAAANF